MSAAVTTGIVNSVALYYPTDPNEFSDLAVLFDQFKMTGLDVHWNNVNLGLKTATATADNQSFVVCGDPGSQTSLASIAQGRQVAYHVMGPLRASGADITREFSLKLRYPPAQVINNSGEISFSQDWWNDVVTSAPPPYCATKSYTVQAIVVSAVIVSQQCMYYLEWRLRE